MPVTSSASARIPDVLCGTQKCSLAAAVFPGFPLCLQQTGTEPGLPGPRGTKRNLPLEETAEVREPAFPGPLPSHRGLPGHLVQAQPPPLPQPHASEAPCSRTFPARPPEKVKEGAAAAPRSEASEGVLSPSGRTEEKGRLWGPGEARWAPERRAALPSVSRPSLLCLIDLAVTFRVRPDRRRCLVNVSAAF